MDDFEDNVDSYDVAVIGMSGRFPGANTIDQFWENLINAKESISFFTGEELISKGMDPELVRRPDYVKAMPVLDGPGLFDAAFFGYSPGEAAIIDPQHRLLLECAWEALEDAGYDPFRVTAPIGVFAGAAMNTYFMNAQLQDQYASNYIPTLIANDKDFLCTRVSYKLNLSGPSITVQTACSTALVAVHTACQSLLNEECAMALAGAMTVRVPHHAGYLYREGGVASPDGHCRPFDKAANGSIFGSGGGIVVLKRLDKAKDDGDHIYAVIKGSAVNNDGAEKAGYTAPGVKSQASVVLEAQANAGTDPDSITFIEAHGSGTAMGDPIEVAALTNAFRAGTSKKGFCALGSVKSNVGHLDVAAGMAGLIKTIMALRHKKIPPTLHYSEANPHIDFENSPFFVNSKTVPWEAGNTPRRAGLSASGMGGTNAHIVLEEAPRQARQGSRKHNLLVLSARSEDALKQAKANLLHYFEKSEGENISDVAYTLQVGRRAFDHRFYLACSGNRDAIEMLQKDQGGSAHTTGDKPIIFLFPGIGDHYVGMGYGLYQREPFFRHHIDRCAEIIRVHNDFDIREVLYPESFTKNASGDDKKGIDLKKMLFGGEGPPDEATVQLNKTLYSQTALFTIEYALARLWMHWGIKPSALIGHSLGEYVAACISGVFSLEDALYIISKRAQLVEALPPGSMIAVTLSENELLPFLTKGLSISLINGPSLCVVAGPEIEIAALEAALKEKDILYRQVQNSQAFHSKMLDPVIGAFTEALEKVSYHSPNIPFISNTSGKWASPTEVMEPGYWARHANHTVRFNDALQLLWAEGSEKILLETGPGLTLSTLANQHPFRDKKIKPVAVSSLRPRYNQQDDAIYLQDALGKLWLQGCKIDWQKQYEMESRTRVSLPSYPFERRNFWLEPDKNKRALPETTQKSDMDQWFYVPTWKRMPALTGAMAAAQEKDGWLIFMDSAGVGEAIVKKLDGREHHVIKVYPGGSFKRTGPESYEIDPAMPEGYSRLLEEIQGKQELPAKVIHCWSCDAGIPEALDAHFYSIFYLVQAIGEQHILTKFHLSILSDQVYEVTGNEKVRPEKSVLTGPCKVVPREYPNITCKNVDIALPAFMDGMDGTLPDTLLTEVAIPTNDSVVALRGGYRWVQHFEPVEISKPSHKDSALRQNGVYVITGGLGSLGMFFAAFLAGEVQARLVLIGRSAFPDNSLWGEWLETHDAEDPISRKIRQLQALEKKGAEVMVISADVGDENQLSAVFSRVREKYGVIHGVLHAAGVVKDKLIQLKSKEETRDILHPKLNGTAVLSKVLESSPFDFLALFSSVSTYIAPPGHADYCAASAFMDAFSLVKNSPGQNIISINWPLWKEIGILEREYENNPANQWVEKALREAIAPHEGVELFKKALSLKLPQVIISKFDFASKVQEAQAISFANAAGVNSSQPDPQKERGTRQQADAGPNNFATKTEQLVAGCWQEVLGLDHIGPHEKFTDIGGHSLLAIQIITRLRTIFNKKISVADILNASTIAQLATLINEEKENEKPVPEIKPVSRESYRIKHQD